MSAETRKLVFKFDGANVNTGAFGKDFVSLFSSVYALAEACSDEEVAVDTIENNCIKITLSVAALACSIVCGDTVSDNIQCIKNLEKYNASVKNINSTLKKRKATLELSDPSNGTICIFDENTEMPLIPDSHTEVKTRIAVYGELQDIGGANPNIHIKSDSFDDDVVLSVNRDVARKLACRLYSQIGVNASVIIRDGKVVSGDVEDIIDYDPEDLECWLKRNDGVLGMEAFRGIDIADFIAEQRI